jgi:hypothetical protein
MGLWLAAAAVFVVACRMHRESGSVGTSFDASDEVGDGGDEHAETSQDSQGFDLVGAPLIFAPTSHGFGVNVALRTGDPSLLSARVRAIGGADWTDLGLPVLPAPDIAQWAAEGLAAGQSYDYEVDANGDAEPQVLYAGSAITARPPGTPFTFAIIADTHIPPDDPLPQGTQVDDYMEGTLIQTTGELAASNPDFIVNLGDILDFHMFGFNAPPPDSSWTRLAYLNYRRTLGDVLGHTAHFPVIGNWDGENGCNTLDEIDRSRSQRLLYLPGPQPDTYPQGGSNYEDYYAFTWGDALFVVLNVMTYTPTCHLLNEGDAGRPDDWTLGAAQLDWLTQTLADATSKWRFLFIHHTDGGKAGDYDDSAYGRGGGQAAYVGEQATVHELMRTYGVQIFFYGHDHVFTDMVVDGIHYTLPGSAGAPWKFDESETGYTQYWPDSGYGKVSVTPDNVEVDFVNVNGQVLDGYSLP